MTTRTVLGDLVGRFGSRPAVGGGGPGRPRRGPEPFLEAICWLGFVVAFVSVVPRVIRVPAVVGALAYCIVRALGWSGYALDLLRSERPNRVVRFVAVGSILLAIAHLSSLGLAALKSGGWMFLWNVDWRWELNHVRAIARFLDVGHALDYAGAPVDYPPGTAWIPAALSRALPVSGVAEFGLFVLLPLLSMLGLVAALTVLLRPVCPQRGRRLLVIAAVLALPAWWFGLRGLVQFLREDPYELAWWSSFWVSTPYAQIGLALGVAVAMSGIALATVGSSPRFYAAAAAGLGSLVQIKPQFFFAGIVLIVGVLVASLVLRGTSKDHVPRLLTIVGAVGIGVISNLLQPLPAQVAAPRFRSAAAFGLGETLERIPAAATIAALAMAALFLLGRRQTSHPMLKDARGGGLVLGSAACALLGILLPVLVTFPYSAEYLDAAARVGMTLGERDAQNGINAMQTLWDVAGLALAAAFAVNLGARRKVVRTYLGGALLCLLALSSLARIPVMGITVASPARGYEAVDTRLLRDALQDVRTTDELIVTSDLADSADDYARPLRAFWLSAADGHRFYLTNLTYRRFMEPDAAERLDNVRKFFGSDWSSFHAQFLERERITHVLTSSRCPPRWKDVGGLRRVAKNTSWTLYEVNPTMDAPPSDSRRVGALRARYGLAPCLDWS